MAERIISPRQNSARWLEAINTFGHDITFRAASDDDEPFLRRVYATTREDELAQVQWDQAAKDAFVAMQFHAQHTFYHDQYPDADYLILLHGGLPVGRLYIKQFDQEIRIVDISILPEYRNRGIGTSVLRAVQAEATRAGKPVSIHVEKFNRALKWYRRLGFLEEEDSGIYLLMKWFAKNPDE